MPLSAVCLFVCLLLWAGVWKNQLFVCLFIVVGWCLKKLAVCLFIVVGWCLKKSTVCLFVYCCRCLFWTGPALAPCTPPRLRAGIWGGWCYWNKIGDYSWWMLIFCKYIQGVSKKAFPCLFCVFLCLWIFTV